MMNLGIATKAKSSLKWWHLMLLSFAISIATYLFRISGSFTILFLGTTVSYLVFGLLFSLKFRANWQSALLLISAKAMHHGLGLWRVEDFYPLYSPLLTLSAFFSLCLGLQLFLPKNKRIHIVFCTTWFMILCLFSTQYLGKLVLHDATQFNLEYQVQHFPFASLDGSQFDEETLKGKIVLLDFWSFYCGSCFKKFPEIEKLHQTYKYDPNVRVMSVHEGSETLAEVRQHRMLQDYTFPVVHDRDGALFKDLQLWGVPQVVLLDPQGQVVLIHQGYAKQDEARFFVDMMIDQIEVQKSNINPAKPSQP